MRRTLIICIIIVIAIILWDIMLQRYVKQVFEPINYMLDEIANKLDEENEINNKEELKNKMGEVDNLWDSKFKKMACFLEHDELEKVKTQLVVAKSAIEVNDRENAYEEINKAKYIIDHIKQKVNFSINNIM